MATVYLELIFILVERGDCLDMFWGQQMSNGFLVGINLISGFYSTGKSV